MGELFEFRFVLRQNKHKRSFCLKVQCKAKKVLVCGRDSVAVVQKVAMNFSVLKIQKKQQYLVSFQAILR